MGVLNVWKTTRKILWRLETFTAELEECLQTASKPQTSGLRNYLMVAKKMYI